jgi:hypothetical protein
MGEGRLYTVCLFACLVGYLGWPVGLVTWCVSVCVWAVAVGGGLWGGVPFVGRG